jgi:hypothetical protein
VELKSHLDGERWILSVALRRLTLADSRSRPEGLRGSSSAPASPFSPKEMRHSFAIWALKKPGAFTRRPYLYYCLRCKWTFRVDRSIIPLDEHSNPIQGAESAKRAATFAEGPCPVFNYLTSAPRMADPLPGLNSLRGGLSALAAAMNCALKRLRNGTEHREHSVTKRALSRKVRKAQAAESLLPTACAGARAPGPQ